MSKGEGDRVSSVDALDVIVDTDAHMLESLEDFRPYIDDDLGGIRRILTEVSDPKREVYQVTSPLPSYINTEMFQERLTEGNEIEPGGVPPNDPETRRKLHDAFGIDYSIVSPSLNLSLATVTNKSAAVGLANGYNDWMLDTFLDDDPTIKAAILVAAQVPEKAAEEIDRLADENDMVAVQMLASGHIPPLSHDRYDPIYEAAQDHDLPLLFHSNSGAITRGFPMQHRWHESFAEDKIVSHPFSHMWNLIKMVLQGIPERFPDLEFVFQEAGISWVPYFKWRLDDYYLMMGDEFPLLTKRPSEYIDERFYFSTQPLGHTGGDPDALAKAIDLVGPENVMYASDLPHTDFDPPEELFDRVTGHFDAETVRGMMGETAIEVFELDS